MNLKILPILTLLIAAGCSQSDSPATTTVPASTEAPAVQDEGRTEVARETAVPERIELAQADSSSSDLAAAGYQEGVQYVLLSPTQPTSSSPDQVEVAEFFMYSCIHCYNFEPYVQQWLTEKPDYINFVRIPTVWNPVVRLHAQAFYAAEALGKGEEMHAPFFREMHVNNNYLQTKEAMADFFAGFDVDNDAFDSAFDSFAVHTKLQRADELARRYRVDSTPTIVVNGKYRTNASMAGGYPQLLELIEALAAAERN